MDCFTIPKQLRDVKRKFDLAELDIRIQDPVRGDISFIESILLSAFPKKELFQPYMDTFLTSEFSDDGYRLTSFYELLNTAYADRLASFVVFAAERKFTEKLQIDPATIELQLLDNSVYRIVNTNYERFLLDNMIPSKRGIEGMYQNEDDLLYDIYVATEMTEHLNKYDYNFYSNPEYLDVNLEENPYHKIFSVFEHCDVSGKAELFESLIDKRVFLNSFKANPSSYKKVFEEINEPYQFIRRSWNNTIDARKEYAILCIKIATLMEFFHRFVEPKIIEELTDLYTSGNGDPKFENHEDAIGYVFSKFGELLLFLYNPYKDIISHDREMLERIFRLYDESLIRSSRPEFIRRLSDLNNVLVQKRVAFPNLNIPPMDLVFKKRKRIIKIYSDRTEPVEYRAMSLEDKSKPFDIQGVGRFDSIKEFMTFAALETIFEVQKDEAYAKRGNFDLVSRLFQQLVWCSVRDAITTQVDSLMKRDDVRIELLKKPKTTGFVYTLNVPRTPFFTFFSDYLNSYLTNTAPSSELVMLKNPVIIEWIEKRQKHLQQIFLAIREVSQVKEKITKRDSLFNLFSLIFCLERIEASVKIPEKTQSKLLEDCELYVREELSFVIANTGVDEDELVLLLQHNGMSVSDRYSEMTIYDIHDTLKVLYEKIAPYIFSDTSKMTEGLNYDLCLSIILGKKIRGVTKDNLGEKVEENAQLRHALKLMYHLYLME